MRFFLISSLALACSSSKPASTTTTASAAPPVASCPADMTHPSGHCAIGTSCPYPEGLCTCDGYHGGVDPGEGDFSHWQCGRTRHRTDHCPDDLKDGMACAVGSGTPDHCSAIESTFCGQVFECKNGRWDGKRDTCAELP